MKNKRTDFTMCDNKTRLSIINNCGAMAYIVYITILSHLNYKTGACYPSLNKLMEETQLSKPTVTKQIQLLKDSGYIDYVKGHFGKEGKNNIANQYYICTVDGQNAPKYSKLFGKEDFENTAETEDNISDDDRPF